MADRCARGRGPSLFLATVLVFLLVFLVALPVGAAGGDPYRPQQWGLERVGAPSAWGVSRGSGQVVAIVDTGVDIDHPDLVNQLFRDAQGEVIGYDFVEDDADPTDLHGHGTMVAGVVAASVDNGIGVASVAPEARIMPVRVLDETAAGGASDVDEGIRWAVDNGATVINLSLESASGLPGVLGVSAPTAAVRYAWDHGVVVVAAAGNSGSSFTDYPSSSPVVLVGATDRDDERWAQSDTGRDDLLMAPGVDIVSTWCRANGSTTCDGQTHNIGEADGTSFAAPHVAGAVALLRTAGLGPQAAIERLQSTARDIGAPGRDSDTGFGLIDISAAVGPGPTSTATPSPSVTSTPPSPSATPSTSPSAAPSPTPSTSPSEGNSPSPSEASPTASQEPPPLEPSSPASPSEPDLVEPSTDQSQEPPVPVTIAGDDGGSQRGALHVLASLLVLATASVNGWVLRNLSRPSEDLPM